MSYVRVGLGLFVGVAVSIGAVSPSFSQSPTGRSPSAALWFGAAFKEDVVAGYAGGVWAPHGSLDADGVLYRASFVYVAYDFNTTLSPSGKADGRLSRGDASIGYQRVANGFAGSLFLGVDYQNHDISPGVADTRKLDDDFGLIITGRLAAVGSSQYAMSLEGNYSTANDTYWARARAGAKLGQITIGPEVAALGNTAYDEVRYGAYADFNLLQNTILQLNVGYADRVNGSTFGGGSDGAYGGVTLVFLY